MSSPVDWESWIDADGPPAGADVPADFPDQLALHRALVALHGEPEAEARLRASVRAALATDSGRWRRRLRRDPRLQRQRTRAGRWWWVAAALALYAIAWWSTRDDDPRPVVVAGVVAGSELGIRPEIGRTFAGATGTTLRWPDGSTVRCVSAARLRVEPSGMLALTSGAVAFSVIPTARTLPFTVDTPREQVEVLGTRFSLAVSDDGTELEVAEGLVAISGAHGRREAGAGSRRFFARDGSAWTVVRRFLPDDAATLAMLGVGSRGTWQGRDALLAGPIDSDASVREIYLGDGRTTVTDALPDGRLVADLALDRPATVRLWIGDTVHDAALSLTIPVKADGTFHRVDVDLATLRDQSGAPAARDGRWANLILIVDDPTAVLAAGRIELLAPD